MNGKVDHIHRSRYTVKAAFNIRIAVQNSLQNMVRFNVQSPVFINLHSKRTSQNPKILFSAPLGSMFYQLLDYECSSFDDSCLSGPIKFHETKTNFRPRIVGSSCGLVCLGANSLGNNFGILNPFTREYNEIPKLNREATKGSNCFDGFGYDSVANDFKLVISMDSITYNIFSLKENSWKIVKRNIRDGCYWGTPATRLNGIFYWLATILDGIFYWLVVPARSDFKNLEHNAALILAFDVGKETFEKLQLPQHGPWNSWRDAGLLEHRGCLSFSKFESFNINKIWMMKESGVWIHFLTIKISPPYDSCRLHAVCISSRDEIVFHNGQKLTRRGNGENKSDEILIQYQDQDAYRVVLYVDTLLSLDGLQLLPVNRKRERS